MPRLRRVLLLAFLLVIVLIMAGLALADPFHLRHARWFTAGLVLLALILATATLAVVVGRGLIRALLLVVGGMAVLGWAAVVWLATGLSGLDREVTAVADGDRRLVVLESRDFSIDPLFSVVLRSGGGAFEQQSLVFEGVEEGPAPDGVRFVDSDTVEVRTGGCLYLSDVELVTLAVDPVHQPESRGTC